ncbi:MFS transporter [Sulfurimonas paralvinellae]|uniref:MFS transporter n=1 Tax=Sulfurimonas paralvinellae TaxID=317658 RepID=A0A7M1B529_9BACT|nr:MFS transporter [Sulfurimonas paralvinellae]QOP44834.1 MFS transporter [Sulfurimonas paralvinellae]
MFFLLGLFYYFYFSIVGIYIIFLPKVLSGVGYSASEIGIIFAAAPLIRFILPFLFIKGLQLNAAIFKVSLVFTVVSALSFYLSLEHFYLLLLSNVALGVGLALILPYVELIALDTIGKEHYGKVRLFGSLGFIIVALLLVRFLSSAYVALDFLFAMTFVMTMAGYLVQRESTNDIKNSEKYHNDISLLKDWQLWFGLLLMQMSFGSFYNFFTIYETDRGISLDMTVYLWSFGVIVEVAMLFFQGRLLRGTLLTVLQVTIFATVIRWFLLFAYPTTLEVLFFAQSLHALSFALFHSAAISYLFSHYKHKSLAQQFFSGITYGLGGLGGALLAGFIYEYYPDYLFLSSSFIALGALLMVSLYKRGQVSLA